MESAWTTGSMIFMEEMEKTPLCAALRAIRYAKRPHMVYDAINQRVSQLISSVTKSRSGHEFSRAYVQKYRTPASARARARARACAREGISGFSFLDFGHITRSRSRPVTEIFREKKRERRRKRRVSLTDFAIAPTFTRDRPNSLLVSRLPRISLLHRRVRRLFIPRSYRSSKSQILPQISLLLRRKCLS